jgi:hypothetical protein
MKGGLPILTYTHHYSIEPRETDIVIGTGGFGRRGKPPTRLRQDYGGFSSPCLLRRASRFDYEGQAFPQYVAGYSAKGNTTGDL